MNRKLLGEDHPEVGKTMSNIAFVLYAKGRSAEAIDLLRQSLALRRAKLGSQHPDVAGGAANLAYWLTDAGEFDEAEALVQESLAARRSTLGDDHPSVASTRTVLANLRVAQHRYAAALVEATEAERILSHTMDASHWQLAMAMNAHGAALAGQRSYVDAERLLKVSLPGLRGSPIPGLVEKGQARLDALYRAWHETGQTAAALHQ
jgi:tetratricopeptide (TPR) repeat protein